MSKFVKRFAACAAVLAVFASPVAADYPEKPIRIIITGQPGGGVDIVARQIGQKLSESWGQPVVIENRPGGGGSIAGQAVVRSDPNGYTLLLGAGTNMTVAPKLYKLGYDPVKDFMPVTEIASAPYLVLVHPSVPVQTLPQLIALIKEKKQKKEEKFSFATASIGTPDHLSGELFKMMARVDMVHIPYKAAPLALIDLRGGHVPMAFATIPTALPHVKSRGVRALAITDSKRSKLLPDIPTVAETLPGYEMLTWYGIWTPAGTPAAVVDKIYREVKRIVNLLEVNALLRKDGFEPVVSTPAEFADFMKKETAKYGEIITAAGVRVN
ncbi:MAG: tripartite tricarboxylate transporter substrate binding protein [Betaproteobacteria bacterium]|nr:tripartite tricarboxylate transporter substrate binding protein [Betaproteobacteria bacterium]